MDAQCILQEVWKDMEVLMIAPSWAKKSAILDLTLKADIHAEHGSRTRSIISAEMRESLDIVIDGLSQLSLPNNASSDDDLTASICGLVELSKNCNKEDLAEELEAWTQIEDTSDFIQMEMQEKEEVISKEAFIASLTNIESETSDEDIKEEIKAEMKSIHDLDVIGICSSLVEVQQLLEQHRVTAAAECIKRGRNLIMRASWNAQKPAVPANAARQMTLDMFLK